MSDILMTSWFWVKRKKSLLAFLNEMKTRLEERGLFANEDKTICCNLSEELIFWDITSMPPAKSIPAKAEDRLYDRLETMWLTNPTLNVEEKAAGKHSRFQEDGNSITEGRKSRPVDL